MSEFKDTSITVVCNDVRLDWFDVVTPKTLKSDPKSKARYSATTIFPPTHPAAELVADAIQKSAALMWGEYAPNVLEQLKAKGSLPLRNGATVLDQAGKPNPNYEGMLFVRANRGENKGPPLVVGPDAKPLSGLSSERLYRGCYVAIKVKVYAQKHEDGGNQVNAQLEAIQFLRGGDAFASGGAPPTAEGFVPVTKAPAKPGVLSSLAGLV